VTEEPPIQPVVEITFVGVTPVQQLARASGVCALEVDGPSRRCLVVGSFQLFLEALRGYEVLSLTSTRATPSRRSRWTDFAGIVESVGRSVTRFQPGDGVFGATPGAFAECVCLSEGGAGAHIQPGQKVLITGASGGVGTFAVQIARAFVGASAHMASGAARVLAQLVGMRLAPIGSSRKTVLLNERRSGP
jgi:hypothetical protein